MTSVAGYEDDIRAAEAAMWWYRQDNGKTGPASAAEMQGLLSRRILSPDTLVWQPSYGALWKRLDETGLMDPKGLSAPPRDHGRWSVAFAKIEADQKARPWSFLGFLLGPIAYFALGMWRKGLVVGSAYLATSLIVTILKATADFPSGRALYFLINAFCGLNLMRDLYRFRMRGERMWPRLKPVDNGLAWGAVAALLFLALTITQLGGETGETMSGEVTGVWSDGTLKVVNDLGGSDKTITYDGERHEVAVQSVEETAGVIVFRDVADPATLIIFQKHMSEDGKTYTLDFLVNDRLIGNLSYVRPA